MSAPCAGCSSRASAASLHAPPAAAHLRQRLQRACTPRLQPTVPAHLPHQSRGLQYKAKGWTQRLEANCRCVGSCAVRAGRRARAQGGSGAPRHRPPPSGGSCAAAPDRLMAMPMRASPVLGLMGRVATSGAGAAVGAAAAGATASPPGLPLTRASCRMALGRYAGQPCAPPGRCSVEGGQGSSRTANLCSSAPWQSFLASAHGVWLQKRRRRPCEAGRPPPFENLWKSHASWRPAAGLLASTQGAHLHACMHPGTPRPQGTPCCPHTHTAHICSCRGTGVPCAALGAHPLPPPAQTGGGITGGSFVGRRHAFVTSALQNNWGEGLDR